VSHKTRRNTESPIEVHPLNPECLNAVLLEDGRLNRDTEGTPAGPQCHHHCLRMWYTPLRRRSLCRAVGALATQGGYINRRSGNATDTNRLDSSHLQDAEACLSRIDPRTLAKFALSLPLSGKTRLLEFVRYLPSSRQSGARASRRTVDFLGLPPTAPQEGGTPSNWAQDTKKRNESQAPVDQGYTTNCFRHTPNRLAGTVASWTMMNSYVAYFVRCRPTHTCVGLPL